MEQDHPAIIPPETFKRVQDELERRKGYHATGGSIFSGKIYCGECGQIYGSKVWHSNDPYRKVVWHCNDKFKNGRKCETPTVTEEEIKTAFEWVLRKLAADKTEVIENLRTVLKCEEDQAVIRQKEKLERERDAVAREANEAISEYARVAQDQNKYNERYAELVSEFDRLDAEVKRLEREAERQKAQKRRIAEFIKTPENTEEKFTEDDWCIVVEKVTMYKDKMVFTLVTGTEIEA